MSPDPVTSLVIGVPVTVLTAIGADFLKRAFGPAIDEYGDIRREEARQKFGQRRAKIIEAAAAAHQEAGTVPTEVDPKILFPLIEKAGLEADEGLQAKWAALLANAAVSPASGVRPIYITILSSLTPLDAQVLDRVHAITVARDPDAALPIVSIHEGDILPNSQIPTEEIEQSINTLVSFGLIERTLPLPTDGLEVPVELYVGRREERPRLRSHELYITALGERFVLACQPPHPNER